MICPHVKLLKDSFDEKGLCESLLVGHLLIQFHQGQDFVHLLYRIFFVLSCEGPGEKAKYLEDKNKMTSK